MYSKTRLLDKHAGGIFMKRALINIDYTVDFIADHGALTCGKPGQAIEEELVRVTKQFIDRGDFVVFAIDKHVAGDHYHPETKLFPPHNIEGTEAESCTGSSKRCIKQISIKTTSTGWTKRATARSPDRFGAEIARERHHGSAFGRLLHRYLRPPYGGRCI